MGSDGKCTAGAPSSGYSINEWQQLQPAGAGRYWSVSTAPVEISMVDSSSATEPRRVGWITSKNYGSAAHTTLEVDIETAASPAQFGIGLRWGQSTNPIDALEWRVKVTGAVASVRWCFVYYGSDTTCTDTASGIPWAHNTPTKFKLIFEEVSGDIRMKALLDGKSVLGQYSHWSTKSTYFPAVGGATLFASAVTPVSFSRVVMATKSTPLPFLPFVGASRCYSFFQPLSARL